MAAVTSKSTSARSPSSFENTVTLIPCAHRIGEKEAKILEQLKPKICPKCQEAFSMYVVDRAAPKETKKDLRTIVTLTAGSSPSRQKTSDVSQPRLSWAQPLPSAAPVVSFAEIMKTEELQKETKLSKTTDKILKAPQLKSHSEKRDEEKPRWKLAPAIEAKIGYTFKDSLLLQIAFTHRSYLNEHPEIEDHNQRLEFLGDAALQLPVSEYLYHRFPTTAEGQLTKMRAKLVSQAACYRYVQIWEVEKFLLLGEGEKRNTQGRVSLLGDLFEAILAAIYLDGGQDAVRQVVFQHFIKEFQKILFEPDENKKAQLQELLQQNGLGLPIYEVIEEEGLDHDKEFTVVVKIEGTILGQGQGKTKKEAEQAAAADALHEFL